LARAFVRADVAADEERLAAAHAHVRVGEIRLALANRLHLGAQQLDAGLDGLFDVVFEARGAIGDGRRVSLAVLRLRAFGRLLFAATRPRSCHGTRTVTYSRRTAKNLPPPLPQVRLSADLMVAAEIHLPVLLVDEANLRLPRECFFVRHPAERRD